MKTLKPRENRWLPPMVCTAVLFLLAVSACSGSKGKQSVVEVGDFPSPTYVIVVRPDGMGNIKEVTPEHPLSLAEGESIVFAQSKYIVLAGGGQARLQGGKLYLHNVKQQ